MDEGLLLLAVGGVLAASVLLALGAARTGLPVLVAFLALGMLLGSDGPGKVDFDDAELAREVGIVGLALILYEGGLQTSWRRLRHVVVPAALLSTIGVVVSTLLTGVAAHVLFDLSWLEAMLLGELLPRRTLLLCSRRFGSPTFDDESQGHWRRNQAATIRWRSL